jgi:uncharacterized membrane protein (UPF0127 family)
MRGLALALLVLCAACGGGDGGQPTVSIDTAGGEITVPVEVADTPAKRERGLMGRQSLASDAGMLFVFPKDSKDAFWMKDTLIPLSIAFYDDRGRILSLLDMEPCRSQPCPLYSPGAAYRGALEVNRGAFDRWGVRVGDRLRLEQ